MPEQLRITDEGDRWVWLCGAGFVLIVASILVEV